MKYLTKRLMPTLMLMSALLSSCSHKSANSLDVQVNHALDVAKIQSINMAKELFDSVGMLPRTIGKDGNLELSDASWWCSGFFPGVLWYLYENEPSDSLLDYAKEYTGRVEDQKFNTGNHDVGFMLYCSFGNGLRLTNQDGYDEVLLTGAKSLASRYKENIGLIRSWDHMQERWQYPVIIDNMMNLELLMWAHKYSGNDTIRHIAITHADNTIKNHFRDDFSTYHVVSYDTITGNVEKKETFQGLSDDSAWARGEAWALYGYTMMYRMTGEQRYLNQAKTIADFIINHPRFPEDKIPYWDFDAPDIPNAKRDASAGAIMCSALLELSGMVDEDLSKIYLDVAETQLATLCSSEYLAEPGTNANFILKHSVGSYPHNSEVDVPLSYADYYFVEALTRYKKLKK